MDVCLVVNVKHGNCGDCPWDDQNPAIVIRDDGQGVGGQHYARQKDDENEKHRETDKKEKSQHDGKCMP